MFLKSIAKVHCGSTFATFAVQAKTIEEIHAEAHAELGMMPATLIPALESLSALPRQAADEVELFPSFKGGRQIMLSGHRGTVYSCHDLPQCHPALTSILLLAPHVMLPRPSC